jgi:hypothetical protein
MKDRNCPYCHVEENGISEGWGYPEEEWERLWRIHIEEHCEKCPTCGHWCRKVVSPIQGNFRYPHQGVRSAQICINCGRPAIYYDGDVPPVGAELRDDSPFNHIGGEGTTFRYI